MTSYTFSSRGNRIVQIVFERRLAHWRRTIMQYANFFPLFFAVPIYWSNRAENAVTAVALYCELVHTFGKERQREWEREREGTHCISVIATGSENGLAIVLEQLHIEDRRWQDILWTSDHIYTGIWPLLKTELRGEVLWQWQPYMLTTLWGRWMIIIIVSDVWPGIDGVAAACFSLCASAADVFNRLTPFFARGQCRRTEKWMLAKCCQTSTNAHVPNCHHNAIVRTVWGGCPVWVMYIAAAFKKLPYLKRWWHWSKNGAACSEESTL